MYTNITPRTQTFSLHTENRSIKMAAATDPRAMTDDLGALENPGCGQTTQDNVSRPGNTRPTADNKERHEADSNYVNSTTILVFLGCLSILKLGLNLSLIKLKGEGSQVSMQRVGKAIDVIHVASIISSIVSMVLFACLSKDRILEDRGISASVIPRRIKMGLLIIHLIFGATCIAVKVVLLITDSTAFKNETSLDLLVNVAVFAFFFAQTLFIGRYRHWRCLNYKLKLTICVLISTNVELGIGASFTFPYKPSGGFHTTSNEKLFAKVDRPSSCFILGFCLISIIFLVKMLNLYTSELENRSMLARSTPETDEQNGDVTEWTYTNRMVVTFCKVYILSLRIVCKYVVLWSVCLCLVLFVYHCRITGTDMMLLDRSCFHASTPEGKTKTSVVTYNYIHSIFYYTFCVVAFFGCIVVARTKDAAQRYITNVYSIEEVILLISLCSQMVVITLQIMDVCYGIADHGGSDLNIKVSFLCKTIFDIFGIFSQTFIILKYFQNAHVIAPATNRNFYIRTVVVFLAVLNTDRWLRLVLFSPSAADYVVAIGDDNDIFGRKVWCQISKMVNPAVAFYRLQSAMMCCEIYLSSRLPSQNSDRSGQTQHGDT